MECISRHVKDKNIAGTVLKILILLILHREGVDLTCCDYIIWYKELKRFSKWRKLSAFFFFFFYKKKCLAIQIGIHYVRHKEVEREFLLGWCLICMSCSYQNLLSKIQGSPFLVLFLMQGPQPSHTHITNRIW